MLLLHSSARRAEFQQELRRACNLLLQVDAGSWSSRMHSEANSELQQKQQGMQVNQKTYANAK